MLGSRPRFHETRNFSSSREFAIALKSCAGGLHPFSLVKYQIVARIGSILLYEEVCILLEAFFVGNKKAEKVRNQPYFCLHTFHAVCVIVQIFSPSMS